jgi:hypothetical protein
LTDQLPSFVGEAFAGLTTDAQKLQFIVSAWHYDCLVGMKSTTHVEQNLALATRACINRAIAKLFRERRS